MALAAALAMFVTRSIALSTKLFPSPGGDPSSRAATERPLRHRSGGQCLWVMVVNVFMARVRVAACRSIPLLLSERLRSPRLFHARPSHVDRHCNWACRTNKGLRTFKERATMKKLLMKKPWVAWGWGAVGAGRRLWRYACVDVLGVDLVRGRARVRVAVRRSIPFLAPGSHRLKMTFTCPPFTCRPPMPLGLPHQQRTCFGATFFARD